MRLSVFRGALALTGALFALSCAESPTAPPRATVRSLPLQAATTYPQVLISQIYGGGGNAGATFRNDFIELFNPGSTPVTVTGWRVAYASSTGSSWSYTSLTGTIQPGGYYLVQQGQGSGGTTALPTPDASGSIAMSATAGKVVLLSDGSTLSGTCPTGGTIVDRVAFGNATGAGSCVPEWTSRTPAPSNTNAVIRAQAGCAFTGSPSADFAAALPTPRNTASPAISPCGGGSTGPTVAAVTLSSVSAPLTIGDTLRLTAQAVDADGLPVEATVTFGSSAPSVASVNATGLVTALAAGSTTITASAGGQSASVTVTVVAAPREVSAFDIRINELMGDPANAESASWGEWFEVYNAGSEAVDLNGWRILSGGNNQAAHVINGSVVVPAGGYAVLGRGFDPARNGGLTLDYNYFVGSSTTIWLDNNDYLVLLDPAQALADSVQWTTLPRGVTKGLRPGTAPVANIDGAEWGFSTTTFGDGDYGTPDAENTGLADVPPFVSVNSISISGRLSSDTLPVGFEDQIFATLRNPSGVQLTTTFVWASLTPELLSIDARGVIRGLGVGTGIVRVTAEDGTGRNIRFPVKEFLASGTDYADPAEFGLPVDADASDDFLVTRDEFTSSFNGTRGIPNWVAYNLLAGHRVAGQERCDCFTFDPILEGAGFTRYTTADYTGAGAVAGAGIDRGHLARSADRTVGALDNARTFYFSNIIPQFADNNQGPWAAHETYLGGLAEDEGKELFIYAGASGSVGTVKNEGLITIPAWTWKVSVIAPAGTRLEDVRDYRDLEVVAVVMPNAPGIRNENWQTAFVVTADSVERLSGYRFLTALPEKTRRALITGTKPPIGAIAAATGLEGAPIAFDGTGSVDPNGTIVTYEWDFGDGSVGSGATATHTYDFFGTYTARLIVTDNDGLADTLTTTVDVRQVTPSQGLAQVATAVESFLAGSGLNRGEQQSVLAKLNAARNALARSNTQAMLGTLGALRNELQALVQSGRAAEHQVEVIELAVERVERATR